MFRQTIKTFAQCVGDLVQICVEPKGSGCGCQRETIIVVIYGELIEKIVVIIYCVSARSDVSSVRKDRFSTGMQ